MKSSTSIPPIVAAAAAGTLTIASILAVLEKRRRQRKRRVVMTGGCGNLATKLAAHLLQFPEKYHVVLIEHPNFYVQERVPDNAEIVLSDLLDESPQAKWRLALKGAYAVIHFSAVNPYLNATWKESADSMMHNFNILLASIQSNVDRFIFASSSHVMGGYKEQPIPAIITPQEPPMCGTIFRNKEDRKQSGDAIAYAAAKLAGEQLCRAVASMQQSQKRTAVIALRIGWCQPGDNLPSTLSAGGVPDEYKTKVDIEETETGNGNKENSNNDDDDDDNFFDAHSSDEDSDKSRNDVDDGHDQEWFTTLWLSNRDFLNLFTGAIEKIDLPRNEFTLVNAMSNNTGMRWSIEKTIEVLGVAPQDDSKGKYAGDK